MDQNLADLLKWAAKHGARDNFHQNAPAMVDQTPSQKHRTCLDTTLSVAIFPEAGGRGLAAVRALTAGEMVLAIPEALLMTAKSGQADSVLGPVLKKTPPLSSHQVRTWDQKLEQLLQCFSSFLYVLGSDSWLWILSIPKE